MRTIVTIILCLVYGISSAQDVHFSHIHASPTFLNPAMNGLFDGGQYRFILNSRLQWENFTKGYKTIAGSVDGKMAQTRNGNIFGAGLQFFSDKAGDLDFATNSVMLSLSALQPLDRRGDSFLSIGLQGGFFNQHFDPSKMIGYEVESLGANGFNNNITAWDVSAGFGWHYARNRQEYYYLGASIFHINQPVVSFFSSSTSTNPEVSMKDSGKMLYRKIVLHGGAKLRIDRDIMILPSFNISDQGPHQEILIGSFVEYQKRKSHNGSAPALYLGGWIRWHLEKDITGIDAMILSLRVDKDLTYYTFSFDVNLSTLTRASNGIGGPELSVIKIIGSKRPQRKRSGIKCPVF